MCRVKVVRSVQCVLVCAVCWCVQCAGKRLLIRGSAPASASALAFAAARPWPCPALRLRPGDGRPLAARFPRLALPHLHPPDFGLCAGRGR